MQLREQRRDPRPIGGSKRRSGRVNRRDLGFDVIGGDSVVRRGCFQMSQAFGDEPAIPPRTILIWKSNGFTGVRVKARGEAGGLKQEQREQGVDGRLARGGEEAGDPR